MSSAQVPPNVCCISFNKTDRIRLMGLTADVIDHLRVEIRQSWGQIQNESIYYGTHEFKMRGHPWLGQGKDAVCSRRLLAGILATMARRGWNLLQAANVSKKESDKDTLFFVRGIPDPDVELFAMSFNMRDTIRIIDAPSLAAWMSVAIALRSIIQSQRPYCGSTELKLYGSPWHPDGCATVYGRMILCQIIGTLKEKGYELYGSININTSDDIGARMDSWIFRRVGPNWS